MIRINLLPKKRKTHIPWDIVFAVAIVVISIVVVAVGWIACEPLLPKWFEIESLNSEKEDLERQIKDKQQLVKQRDDKKRDYNKIRNEIVKLQRLSGANLVQWSKTLSTVKDLVPKDKVWITNLRIDSDRRVQITAYSCVKKDEKSNTPNNKAASSAKLTEGIQGFIKNLLGNEFFEQPFLTGATQNIYEKQPVWRFELNCRLIREMSKSGD